MYIASLDHPDKVESLESPHITIHDSIMPLSRSETVGMDLSDGHVGFRNSTFHRCGPFTFLGTAPNKKPHVSRAWVGVEEPILRNRYMLPNGHVRQPLPSALSNQCQMRSMACLPRLCSTGLEVSTKALALVSRLENMQVCRSTFCGTLDRMVAPLAGSLI